MTGVAAAALAEDLARGIASGRWAVGELLPTEFELCGQYGASRYAVRQALERLQEQGLISRRRNVGTRVESARPRTGFEQSIASVDDLVQFGAQHVRDVRSVRRLTADRALAGSLGCEAGTRWLRVSSVRLQRGAHDRPLCWTDVYVDARHAGIARQVRASPRVLVSTLIEQQDGRAIASIAQEIQAVCLDPSLAAELQAPPGAPALRVLRRYQDAQGLTFEISVSVHPADRFSFAMTLKRAPA